jgi:hypothetical protein
MFENIANCPNQHQILHTFGDRKTAPHIKQGNGAQGTNYQIRRTGTWKQPHWAFPGQHYGRFCKIHTTWTEVDESYKSWTKGPITVSQDNRPPLSTWRLNTLTESSGMNNKGQDGQMHEPYLWWPGDILQTWTCCDTDIHPIMLQSLKD